MNSILENAFAKAEDSFEDARILMPHKRYSAAINRCYYFVFYVVSALLSNKNIHVKTHSGIIRKFSEMFIQNGEFPEHLISIYRKIFEKRQVADYDLEYHADAEEAEKTIADTREFLDTIKKILSHN